MLSLEWRMNKPEQHRSVGSESGGRGGGGAAGCATAPRSWVCEAPKQLHSKWCSRHGMDLWVDIYHWKVLSLKSRTFNKHSCHVRSTAGFGAEASNPLLWAIMLSWVRHWNISRVRRKFRCSVDYYTCFDSRKQCKSGESPRWMGFRTWNISVNCDVPKNRFDLSRRMHTGSAEPFVRVSQHMLSQ